MKIVDVRALTVSTPWKNWLIVSVDTDEGLVGYGEGRSGTPPSRSREPSLRSATTILGWIPFGSPTWSSRCRAGGPPEGPGLGIELDEEAEREFPYDGDNFLDLFEAGWELRRE